MRDEIKEAGGQYYNKLLDDLAMLNDTVANYTMTYNTFMIFKDKAGAGTKKHMRESLEALRLSTTSYRMLLAGIETLYNEKDKQRRDEYCERYNRLEELGEIINNCDIADPKDAEEFVKIANKILVGNILRDVLIRIT